MTSRAGRWLSGRDYVGLRQQINYRELAQRISLINCSSVLAPSFSLGSSPRHVLFLETISSNPSTEAGPVSMVCRVPFGLDFSGGRRVLCRGSISLGEEEA